MKVLVKQAEKMNCNRGMRGIFHIKLFMLFIQLHIKSFISLRDSY